MHEIVFVRTKKHGKLHTLDATLDLDGALVFDEVDSFPPLGGDQGREVDDYLTIAATHKPDLLHRLVLAFDGLSDTCAEIPDERLLCALQGLADLGHWRTLDEVETWLLEYCIPFTKQRRVEIKHD